MTPVRTVLAGTCLLQGKHPPGSPEAAECPILRRQEFRERAQKAAAGRWAPPRTLSNHPDGAQGHPDACGGNAQLRGPIVKALSEATPNSP
jgi:hypothetical protein